MKLLLSLLAIAVSSSVQAGIVFSSATSSTAAGLQPAIDAFRATIGGGTVAGANGSFGGVRREVNWDGVPDNRADPALMPATFFVDTSPRGLGLSGAVNGFAVSGNPGVFTPLFELFDAPGLGNGTYDFQAFSNNRIFSGIGGTQFDVSFFVPGTGFANQTFSLAFGVVFIDNTASTFPNCASITAFNGNSSLGFRCATPTSAGGFSFLGVVATGADVLTRIAINQGSGRLGTPQAANNEVVVMDDFIYAEPGMTALPGTQPAPEPGTAVLGLAALMGLGAAQRIRRRRAARS